MGQVVITEYQLKIDEYTRKLEELREKTRRVEDERKKSTNAEKENINELARAAEKRKQLLKQETETLKKLQGERAKAFTIKDIEAYNKKIAETQKNINILKGRTEELNGITSGLKSGFKALGAGIVAAFSAQAVIAFAQQTIEAFLEAEKAAELLKFAIVDIGGESERQFTRLIQQSMDVQKTTIFGDDQVQQAQAALSAFGLTANQIEELIPRLADFAVVLGTDIVDAANKVGGGLVGAGRELKRFNIDVSANKTEIENYNAILAGLEKFSGTAAKAANTLSGELAKQKNEVSDLQEEIGSKLAPQWINFKKVVLEGVKALVTSRLYKPLSDAEIKASIKPLEELGKKLKEYGKTNEEIIEILEKRAEAEENNTEALNKTLQQKLSRGAIAKEIDELKQKIELSRKAVDILRGQADRLRETEKQNLALLKTEELRQFNLIDLNALLDENKKKNDIISQSNVKVLEKEIELRKKAAEEAKKQNVKTKQELLRQEASILTVINKARLESATGEEKIKIQFEIDNAALEKGKEDLRSIAEIEKSIEEAKLKAKKLLNERYTSEILAELEKQIQAEQKGADDALKERLRITAQGNKLEKELRLQGVREGSAKAIEIQKQLLKEEYDEKIKIIEATVANELDANQQIALAKKELADNLKKLDKEIANSIVNTFNEIAGIANSIYGEIINIQRNASEERIRIITEEGEAVRAALEAEIQEVTKQREGKYIGEKVYQERLQKLTQQKLANEKKVQAEINKEKRKQAEAERAYKLFEIAINTASAILKITSQTGIFAPPFIAATVALAALQAAAVLSAPLPKYEKGTKRKKDSGLAIVGERGEEVVNLPAGSQVLHNRGYKKHREAINAMMDNKFEEFVYSRYVVPEMRRMKEESKAAKMQYEREVYLTAGGIDEYGMRRVAKEGMRISNAEEIAMLIAGQLNTDIRRRM